MKLLIQSLSTLSLFWFVNLNLNCKFLIMYGFAFSVIDELMLFFWSYSFVSIASLLFVIGLLIIKSLLILSLSLSWVLFVNS
nr:hypothetical protein [Ureaplasma parvum]